LADGLVHVLDQVLAQADVPTSEPLQGLA